MTDKMLVAMLIILALPYLLWRLGRTEHWAPLVVIQILTGIALGPGLLGSVFPHAYQVIFTPEVMWMLGGLASWGVILFVWLAGLELDLTTAWSERRDGVITAACALVFPMLLGGAVGLVLLTQGPNWMGQDAMPWQFVAGIGMACAVTALPILMLFMNKLGLLRQPFGQRVLRYASLDDIAIWGVLAVIVLDFDGLLQQLLFMVLFVLSARLIRQFMPKLPLSDRWSVSLIWLTIVAFAADWSGLHYMVGAFLAGAAMDRSWFDEGQVDRLREMVLLVLMPVFFLSTGLKTQWTLGGSAVIFVAMALLLAAIVGKWLGVKVASLVLGWPPGEARLIAWLLQTKALIMIIFSNVLLEKAIISSGMFTALLLMATFSTMLTIPMATQALKKMSAPSADG